MNHSVHKLQTSSALHLTLPIKVVREHAWLENCNFPSDECPRDVIRAARSKDSQQMGMRLNIIESMAERFSEKDIIRKYFERLPHAGFYPPEHVRCHIVTTTGHPHTCFGDPCVSLEHIDKMHFNQHSNVTPLLPMSVISLISLRTRQPYIQPFVLRFFFYMLIIPILESTQSICSPKERIPQNNIQLGWKDKWTGI